MLVEKVKLTIRTLGIVGFLLIAQNSWSQTSLGLRFATAITPNRTLQTSDSSDVDPKGAGLRFLLGFDVDFVLSTNYTFNTGLHYAPKRVSVLISPENGVDPSPQIQGKEEYRLQYIQIPLTLKMYTSEIGEGKRLFFQPGFVLEYLVFSEPLEDEYTLVEEFSSFDISFNFGVHLEYSISSTVVTTGLSYYRGLINSVQTVNPLFGDDLTIRNDMIAISFGLRF